MSIPIENHIMITSFEVYFVVSLTLDSMHQLRLDTIPAELSHGVRETENTGSDHGRDIVKRSVPPLRIS